jgi:glucan phosphoethanolaminetransferase (alkaline phosphatase superfamily)
MKKDSVTASVMVYMSDHGENLFDDERTGFGHGSSIITSFEKEIPLLLFTSEKYRMRYPHKVKNVISNVNAPVNTDHFFHSILDLGGVYIDEETTKKSFASGVFGN